MNSDIAWNFLANISVGTIISWLCLLGISFSVVAAITIKIYKLFEKSRNIKEENDEFKQLVKNHENTLKEITEELKCIRKEQERSKGSELKRLRHSIIKTGEEAISNKYITIRGLKSIEELYEDYTNFKDENGNPANGFVKSLMVKVRLLNVIGKLDENDNDIE